MRITVKRNEGALNGLDCGGQSGGTGCSTCNSGGRNGSRAQDSSPDSGQVLPPVAPLS